MTSIQVYPVGRNDRTGAMSSLALSDVIPQQHAMKNYTDIFEPDCFYHIYNRAIGNDLLFYQTRNYQFMKI